MSEFSRPAALPPAAECQREKKRLMQAAALLENTPTDLRLGSYKNVTPPPHTPPPTIAKRQTYGFQKMITRMNPFMKKKNLDQK